MIKMICDCCGKEFHTEYWEGGYIDHVTNFSSRFEGYAKREDSIDRLSHDIVFSGNDIRSSYDMMDRLECMLKSIYISDDIKTAVGTIVIEMIARLNDARKEVSDIENSASPLALAMLRRDSNDDAYYKVYGDLLNSIK